ncbi:acyl-CoA dehydrogenase [Sediminicurvatus halobius]|uniref:Acyl-coenzyme A dehydrogenase n=1 Tax=Sediminicurvatus halobius TaxID=2182432 RepID=A0A2U2N085_9GAMM|nr:acyl-CoA dehydrogenase [Spiribacter halobius]PWG62379.1 acyl-CoA dehydrogenase [Spiribacter halobius]UEX79476.1 acyl-CoA dehydrogenase [Spiribacter halobius]
MTTLAVILLLLAGALALAFVGVPLIVWTVALAALVAVGAATGVLGSVATAAAVVLLGPPALVLNVPALRRQLLSARLLTIFRRVLPPVSQTEREALEAGDTWWETDLFRGRPDWQRLLETRVTELSAEERSFIDNEVETLCAMLDEDRIVREDRDLSPAAWDYLRRERFFSLIIPRRYGGREFSSLAQSTVVAKISTRSLSAAVTVMVPNSLGPGELLLKYGTEAQKDYWLPRLADGREIPCFALTGPDVGSDAGSMPDYGVVCRGEHEGREVLGIRLNFSKRYITLAPVATVLGLAFRLHDPDHLLGERADIGITCALIPADHPGVRIGQRHFPMGLAFMNGPIEGEDVFIPLDWIIGGQTMAGRGWRMLVECLSVGRAISLPALGTAASKVAYRMTGAYARIRRQFKLPIGRFEGVQEAMARIGGGTYTLEAARVLTASAGDLGVRPSVVSAIAKYHMTERMRGIVNDAMDVHAGRAVIFGPRNYLGYAYQAVPVGITVEGANILTRSLMIYGQGAIRCHPYVFDEMEAARADDVAAFDRLLFSHLGYTVNRGVRAFLLGLTGARLARSPADGELAGYYRQLERMSAALAFVSDVAMARLGGDLKRRERLSARLGDVLSQLYLASAVLKYHHDGGRDEAELPYVRWALEQALFEIQRAFEGFFENFPGRFAGGALRWLVFPLGRPYRAPADRLGSEVARSMMTAGAARDRISADMYLGDGPEDAIGRMEATFALLERVEPVYERFLKAAARGELDGHTFEARLESARAQGVLGAEEAALVAEYEALRREAIATDVFEPSTLSPAGAGEAPRRADVA